MVQPAVSASTFLSKSADKLLLQMLIPSAAWRQYDSHSSYAHMKHVLVGQSAVKHSKVLLSNIYSDIFCSKTNNMNATRKKKAASACLSRT